MDFLLHRKNKCGNFYIKQKRPRYLEIVLNSVALTEEGRDGTIVHYYVNSGVV